MESELASVKETIYIRVNFIDPLRFWLNTLNPYWFKISLYVSSIIFIWYFHLSSLSFKINEVFDEFS